MVQGDCLIQRDYPCEKRAKKEIFVIFFGFFNEEVTQEK